ncbi:hypothetical protein OJAV_G00185330, partial [Oryzias javanicus]
EELLSPPPGTKDSVRIDLPLNNDEDDGSGGFDDEVNDEEEQVQPSAASRKRSNNPDFEIPSRSMSKRRAQDRAWIKKSLTHLDLRVRFIKDQNVEVGLLSYLKNTLVRDLSFPRNLQESEFVDLLRSSFPPLAGSHKAFEIHTLNRNKKLQKLPLKTMTPNEIIRSIKANAPRATVLFIKLKKTEAENKSEETSEEKLEGASEEIKEKSKENLEENIEEILENTKDNLEEDIEENVEENIEENVEEHLDEDIEDSRVSTVKDKPSSCDTEAEGEEEAGPSSR